MPAGIGYNSAALAQAARDQASSLPEPRAVPAPGPEALLSAIAEGQLPPEMLMLLLQLLHGQLPQQAGAAAQGSPIEAALTGV